VQAFQLELRFVEIVVDLIGQVITIRSVARFQLPLTHGPHSVGLKGCRRARVGDSAIFARSFGANPTGHQGIVVDHIVVVQAFDIVNVEILQSVAQFAGKIVKVVEYGRRGRCLVAHDDV